MKFTSLAIVALLINSSSSSVMQIEAGCPGNNCGATVAYIPAQPVVQVTSSCPAAAAATATAASPAAAPVHPDSDIVEEVIDSAAKAKKKEDNKKEVAQGKKEIQHAIKSALKELTS